MLGRGHLSILRQGGHGSWPDRENFSSTPATGREDMVLMDGQLERDSLLEFCPKNNRPRKCFSPPKRPWDLCKASQPKRLWDFSPPFSKERLQVNTRSIRRSQDPREQCCGSVDRAGSFSGISNHVSSVHRCTMRLPENGESAARRPPSGVPRAHVDEANVKQGFWLKQNEPSPVEPALNQDHYLPSSFDHEVNSFAKAVTGQESKASQLSAKVETLEIQEIESLQKLREVPLSGELTTALQAQMALLCERLAWHVTRCTKRPCKAGEVNSFDSEESLLLKGIGVQLNKIITVPTKNCSESRREQEKDFEAGYPDGQEIQEICRCRNLAWKCGINTLFQALLWCIGFMMTIVRCNSVPMLLPT